MGMQSISGGCQCGKVRYKANASLDTVYACNCSRCGRLGTLLAFTPASEFELLSGEGAQTEYPFNKKHISHLFCSSCGIQVYGQAATPDGTPTVALNARCMDGVDPDSLNVQKIDGASY